MVPFMNFETQSVQQKFLIFDIQSDVSVNTLDK